MTEKQRVEFMRQLDVYFERKQQEEKQRKVISDNKIKECIKDFLYNEYIENNK